MREVERKGYLILQCLSPLFYSLYEMALINRIFPNTISLRSSQSTTSKSDSCLAAGKRLTKQRETIAQAIKNQLNSQKINSNVGDSIG